MNIGMVKWFNAAKDFGFIEQEDVSDIFVQHPAINGDGCKTLAEGAAVSFAVVDAPQGPAAANVVRF